MKRRRTSAGRGPANTRRSRWAASHLHAPDAAPALVEAEVARLGIVHQHAVAGGGEQPGHGVVGGVRARVVAPGGNERRDDRAVVLLVGTLGHVALDLAAALVHAVRALAEAEVALARAGAERDAGGLHDRRAGADHLHAQRHHAARVGREADERAGGRPGRRWRTCPSRRRAGAGRRARAWRGTSPRPCGSRASRAPGVSTGRPPWSVSWSERASDRGRRRASPRPPSPPRPAAPARAPPRQRVRGAGTARVAP